MFYYHVSNGYSPMSAYAVTGLDAVTSLGSCFLYSTPHRISKPAVRRLVYVHTFFYVVLSPSVVYDVIWVSHMYIRTSYAYTIYRVSTSLYQRPTVRLHALRWVA